MKFRFEFGSLESVWLIVPTIAFDFGTENTIFFSWLNWALSITFKG